jgi:hypothetical protein
LPHFRTAPLGVVAVAACLAVSSRVGHAATPLMALRYAADITVALSGTTVTPANVAEDNLTGTVTVIGIGSIPADARVDAYQLLPNGNQLLSFDTTVSLPGGVVAGPADVVRFDGSTYAIAFSAAANGIPEGVNTDAVAVSDGDLLLSFDTSVQLSGTTFEDEDLAHFTGSAFLPFFTGATAGVPADLDLDGAQVLAPKHLLVSFDGSGTVGGVVFNDDDVLEYDAGTNTWELAYHGSAEHPGWADANLVAPYALVVPPSPTPTATLVPSATATPSPTTTATTVPPSTTTATVVLPATETPTATQTTMPTSTATPVVSGTPTPSPATPSPTTTATTVPSSTTTATVVLPATETPTATQATMPTSTATPVTSGTPTPSLTPVTTQTTTPANTETPSATPPPSMTPTATPPVTGTPSPSATATSTTPGVCVGDCNGSREVTVNELLVMVNITLGAAPVTGCIAGDANADGEITINEIIRAVNNALDGC